MSKQNNNIKLIMENFRKLIETEEASPAREIDPAKVKLINEEKTVSTQTKVAGIPNLWTPEEECRPASPLLTMRGRIDTGRMCAHGCDTVTQELCAILARKHTDYKQYVYEESEDIDDEEEELTDRAQDGTEITEGNVVEHVKNGTWVREGERTRPFPNANEFVVKGVFKLQQFLDVRTDGVIGRETMRALRNKYYGR